MEITKRIRQRKLQRFGHVRNEAEDGLLRMVEGMDSGGPGKEDSGETEENMEKDSAAGLERCWELEKRSAK